ncbi:hypothetical protein CVT26_009863 [Gymnopilus dilepis]|uniref:Protein kinase domain-containing protein n=1 Tax=Gymnopilus dilepis TaxID=231916 RepID=A0A409YC56_9AGAR|nr:hypothetical protein CVT26_009863 [Gymnopilus dilepis]
MPKVSSHNKDMVSYAIQYKVAQVIANRYCITRVLRSDGGHQVLKVVDTSSERVKFVKAISRVKTREKEITGNLAWLRSRRTADGRHSQLLDHFCTGSMWFMVFDYPKATLRDILRSQDLLPLPMRHIREIACQIVNSVLSLHRQAIFHLDIKPENIEILDMNTVIESVYEGEGHFKEKSFLRCTRLSLVFLGDAGVALDQSAGSDQYRAPELVFGWVSKFRTDNFSIGCVLWELIVLRPLFAACEPGGIYARAKAHMYSAVFGPFTREMRQQIMHFNQGIFRTDSSEVDGLQDMPQNIKEFVATAPSLEDVIEDEELLEVLVCLTRLSPTDRLSLNSVLALNYFDQRL